MSDEIKPKEAEELQPEPQAEPQAEPQDEPQAELQDEPQAEPQDEPQAESQDEPQVESQDEPQAESQDEIESPVVSLADLDARGSGARRVDAVFAKVQNIFQGRGWLPVAGVVLLALLALFLPPFSLGARMAGSGGYTALNAETPSLAHPDGLTVTVDPAKVEKLRLKLSSVPLLDFLDAEATEEVLAARESLPASLEPKSPYYEIEMRGDKEPAGPATLSVIIPNAAEPWETLDLYAWDGNAWQWLPSRLDEDQELLMAEVNTFPRAVMVMQTTVPQQALITEAQDLPAGDKGALLTQVDLEGMKIGTLGGLTGDPALLPPGDVSSNPVLAPVVRNWVPGHEPNRGLVADMLTILSDRTAHRESLTALVQDGSYQGLVLDYRGLRAQEREAYASFVTELAAALHENGVWLAVTVDPPQLQPDDSWDTAGYDWMALGAAADQLRVMMPLDPQAYVPGGQVEQLLVWATSQVNRYKLVPIFSTLSTDGKSSFTMDEVLASLGELTAPETLTESVAPGAALNFQLADKATVESDALTGATRLQMGDSDVWLGTKQWLRARLDLTARYHLGGVVLRDWLDEGNFPGMAEAVAGYREEAAAVPYTLPEVLWQVTAPDGQVTESSVTLDKPQFAWVAPEITGTYCISASVAGVSRGSVKFAVVKPVVLTVTAEVTDTDTTSLTVGLAEDAEPAVGLKAAFVADVTVPDNTHFDKGAQFTKTWRMLNAGSEAWPEDTKLVFNSGTQMTDVSEVEVGAVEPGASVDISVDMTAPNEDGTFKGQWGLATGGAPISGGAMYLVIVAGEEPEPTPAPAPAPAPAPVAGGAFELGGHILQGFNYADTMHYAGMNWVKIQARYPGDPSGMIAAAHANGFNIQVSALGESGMVTQGDFNAKIANWVAGMAAAGANAIEVWNEPNLPREWQAGSISPEAYTQLLCQSYAAIKAANPGTAVISAAPAPTGFYGGCSPNGCDDLPWLQRMYNAGAVNCFDYIGAHHNAGATAPAATTGHPADNGGGHHSWYFLPQTRLYYNTFGGARQLFYTELGYVSPEGFGWIPDNFWWGANTTVAQQAQWLSEVVSLSSQTGMVRVVIVWNVDATCYGQCGGMGDPQAGFAIIRPNGSCPACDSLHALLGSR